MIIGLATLLRQGRFHLSAEKQLLTHEMNPKIRIKDIAKMANVSVGTVDRVIHNRGEVSEESFKKVMSIQTKPLLLLL
jgi:transposase